MSTPRRLLRLVFPILIATVAGGCASADGWRGAETEKAYEVAAAQSPSLATPPATYFEVHRDGRIHVFSEPGAYQAWQQTGELPMTVTLPGAGPAGETLVFQRVGGAEAFGGRGPAQRLYSGELMGIETGFHGEIHRQDGVWVFSRGSLLREFKLLGTADCMTPEAFERSPASSPPVRFVQDCEMLSITPPLAAIARYRQFAGLPD